MSSAKSVKVRRVHFRSCAPFLIGPQRATRVSKRTLPNVPPAVDASAPANLTPTVARGNLSTATIDTRPETRPELAASVPASNENGANSDPALRSKRTRDSQGREPRKRSKSVSCRRHYLKTHVNIICRRDYTGTLSIIAGKHSEKFTVHQDRICKASPFFKAACSREWLEGQTGIIRLPELSSKYFCHYVDSVYSDRVNLHELKQDLIERATNDRYTEEEKEIKIIWIPVHLAHAYCKVWVIADYLRDTACKNACMEVLLINMNRLGYFGLFRKTIDFVAENTATDSPLFRWMVDHIAAISLNFVRVSVPEEDVEAADDELSFNTDRLPLAVKDALLKVLLVSH